MEADSSTPSRSPCPWRRTRPRQKERPMDRSFVMFFLLRTRSLALQRVDAALREAHDNGGKPREKAVMIHAAPPSSKEFGLRTQCPARRRRAIVWMTSTRPNMMTICTASGIREHRVVMLLFVELVLLSRRSSAIAVVLHFQAIQGGHKLHHDDRVLLGTKATSG